MPENILSNIDDIENDDELKNDSTHSNHDSAMSSYSSTNNSSDQYDFEDDDDEEDARQQRSTNGSVGDNNNQTDVEYFASNENRWVQYSRILIVVMLIGSAATASFLTYYFLTKDERNEFRVQFSFNAEEIIKKSDQKIQNAFRSMVFLSSLVSSSSSNTNTNNTFPFYTMEDYEVFGYQTMILSGASLVGYTPLIVESDRLEWEEYSVQQQGWIENGFALGKDNYKNNSQISNTNDTIPPYIYRALSYDTYASSHAYSIVKEKYGLGQYSPMWQMSPPPSQSSPANLNLLSYKLFHRLIHYINKTGTGVLSEVVDTAEMFNVEPSTFGKENRDTPKSIIVVPIFDSVVHPDLQNLTIVAHAVAVIPWTVFLDDTMKNDNHGILAVLTQSCGGSYTFGIDGSQANFLGSGDLHDPKYENLAKFQRISAAGAFMPGHQNNETNTVTVNATNDTNGTCSFEMAIYPTQQFEDMYETKRPLYVTLGVLVVFSFTSLMFLLYDGLVQYRQSKLMAIATKTSSIISNLFPAQVRDQLFGRLGNIERRTSDDKSTASKSTAGPRKDENRAKSSNKRKKNKVLTSSSYFPENFNPNGSGNDDEFDIDSKPIADLFPSATVLFGDIAGFTAWSSVREPSQVFILLETIYRAFDKIAKKRRVFKVETIGDCYVAVVGLPDPCKEHALVMARFARDILEKLNNLTHKLEVSLGPDTGDLMMRIGCHSGPVTAGVLRGERARFQLFGDTVNTAARMESTGMKNRIQISQETADLIIAGGKANWVELREDIVHAKGKGELQTYWLKHKSEKVAFGSTNSEMVSDVSTQDSDCEGNGRIKYDGREVEAAQPTKNDKRQRMIDWNADILIKLLQRVLATRTVTGSQKPTSESDLAALEISINRLGHCMQDVVEVIDLPKFDEAAYEFDLESAGISASVAEQMRSFVTIIASMYRPNPFHNFEHASHVSMSTVKLLSRIVAPTTDIIESIDEEFENRDLHDYTYGITSDPLTQFAVVFSSLIHDVDHKGVPNFVLCKEEKNLATVYKDQSVAEQNSVDIAWGLLMEPNFKDLRRAIYTNEDEMRRFRRLVVNSVIATDIFDKELSTLRKNRWAKAFNGDDSFSDTARCRKATIVIEHLIQASDVSHTMQHWHVYQKWNERLYREMYNAYMTGRTDKDPTEGWYQGELNFFDGYIIPLARKLKECGVFGVSSDEYLNYAEKNRAEWERKGKGIVAMMLQKYGGQSSSDAMQLANLDQALRNFSPEGKR